MHGTHAAVCPLLWPVGRKVLLVDLMLVVLVTCCSTVAGCLVVVVVVVVVVGIALE